jgi:hypothetical protein
MYMCSSTGIVVKEFDEDDQHRLSDSIGTAFYEGEGDVYRRSGMKKTDPFQ